MVLELTMMFSHLGGYWGFDNEYLVIVVGTGCVTMMFSHLGEFWGCDGDV